MFEAENVTVLHLSKRRYSDVIYNCSAVKISSGDINSWKRESEYTYFYIFR